MVHLEVELALLFDHTAPGVVLEVIGQVILEPVVGTHPPPVKPLAANQGKAARSGHVIFSLKGLRREFSQAFFCTHFTLFMFQEFLVN